VDVCVNVPRLAVDRPFTYLAEADLGVGVGSLVSVPFHGRSVDGWVLGPAREAPEGRLLPVRRARSPVRFFDERLLALFRWMSRRYLAPLATVIARSHPPRVASEEASVGTAPDRPVPPMPASAPGDPGALARYGGGGLLRPGVVTWLRPLPGEEAEACVAAVAECLRSGRTAVVLVPEADPLPATARAVLEAFPGRAAAFVGGDPRTRYRTWLRVRAGTYDVVVGTRPAVFAPLARLGLLWVCREVHPGHREDRAPYYHVREVAQARARLEGAACVVASLAPTVETAVAARAGRVRVARPPRRVERAAAPLVETAPPEGEDRSRRLGTLLRGARSGALVVSRPGYGVARVCRSCGEPAACAGCRGPVVVARGTARCSVCGAEGRCAGCGGRSFGVERGGAERAREWAARVAPVPVHLAEEGVAPGPGRVVVGTAAAVRDLGTLRLDLVAILDPDRALARPGIHAGERALATWMEAAAWAGPRGGGGRVLVQTRQPGHPAVQALVRWDPEPYLLEEGRRRAEAGFPPGHPVFRVSGRRGLAEALGAAGAETVLAAGPEGDGGATLCLVAVPPRALPAFREAVLRLAAEGAVERVEAEPQL
jgi:primosomal protein N' (replication factor Y)